MITVTITCTNEIAKVLHSMHLPGLVEVGAISPTLDSCERGHNHLSLPVKAIQLSLHLPRLRPCILVAGRICQGNQELAPPCISHAVCRDQGQQEPAPRCILSSTKNKNFEISWKQNCLETRMSGTDLTEKQLP